MAACRFVLGAQARYEGVKCSSSFLIIICSPFRPDDHLWYDGIHSRLRECNGISSLYCPVSLGTALSLIQGRLSLCRKAGQQCSPVVSMPSCKAQLKELRQNSIATVADRSSLISIWNKWGKCFLSDDFIVFDIPVSNPSTLGVVQQHPTVLANLSFLQGPFFKPVWAQFCLTFIHFLLWIAQKSQISSFHKVKRRKKKHVSSCLITLTSNIKCLSQ